MKIGIFADPHCADIDVLLGKRYPRRSFERTREIMRRFAEDKADMAVCLGDLINRDARDKNLKNLRAASLIMLESGIECVLVPGNHDREVFSSSELAEYTALSLAPAVLERGGLRLVFLDSCNNDDGSPYETENVDWTNSFVTRKWLDILGDECAKGEKNIVVFAHGCIDPGVERRHLIRNADEIRGIILASGRVRGVYCGHYHPGFESVIGGVPFHTLPAVCENGGGITVSL